MTLFSFFATDARAASTVDGTRLALKGSRFVAYAGSGLPLGYFCSVTPP